MKSSFYDRKYDKMAEQAVGYANTQYNVCFICLRLATREYFVSTNGRPSCILASF